MSSDRTPGKQCWYAADCALYYWCWTTVANDFDTMEKCFLQPRNKRMVEL